MTRNRKNVLGTLAGMPAALGLLRNAAINGGAAKRVGRPWALGAAAALALAWPAQAATVKLCTVDGYCKIFENSRPCIELKLPEGMRCRDVAAAANLIGFEDPSGRGVVDVVYAPGGAVLAVLSDGSGAEAGRTRLIDLSPYLLRGTFSTGASVRDEGSALILDLEVSLVDPETFEVRETTIESIDVSAIAFGPACPADVNGDARLNIRDFVAFQASFRQGEPRADFNGDGSSDINDFIAFRAAFARGCP